MLKGFLLLGAMFIMLGFISLLGYTFYYISKKFGDGWAFLSFVCLITLSVLVLCVIASYQTCGSMWSCS